MGRIHALWAVYYQCLSLRIPTHFPPSLCGLWSGILFFISRNSTRHNNPSAFCRLPPLPVLGILYHPYGNCSRRPRAYFSPQLDGYLAISLAGIPLAAGNRIFQFGFRLYFWGELYVYAKSAKGTIRYWLFWTVALVHFCLWSIWIGILHFLFIAVPPNKL